MNDDYRSPFGNVTLALLLLVGLILLAGKECGSLLGI